MKIKIAMIAMTVVFVIASAHTAQAGGPTYVSGILPGNTTWTVADSPYIIITGGVMVPQGVTLKIDPGVEVKFDGFFVLRINGELIAKGTPTQKIKFTSNKATPQAGDWASISFMPSSVDAVVDQNNNHVSGSVISYAEINFGGGLLAHESAPLISTNDIHINTGAVSLSDGGISAAVVLSTSEALVLNNFIHDNLTSGVGIDVKLFSGWTGIPKIIGNTIQKNKTDRGGINQTYGTSLIENNQIIQNEGLHGGGISIYNASPTIRHNVITHNCISSPHSGQYHRGTAINITLRSNSAIEYNTIENNTGPSGPRASLSIEWNFNGKINHNNISNPTTYEIYIINNLGLFNDTTIIDATYNYWGTTDTDEIDARIWDKNDEFDVATVDYGFTTSSFLTRPEMNAPQLDPSLLRQPIFGCGIISDPDSDNDGVPDSLDKCSNTPSGLTVDATGCEPDADMDGIPDARDRCPNTPLGAAVDADGCPTPPVCTITVAPGRSGGFVLTATSPNSYIMEVTANGKSQFSSGKQGGNDICAPGRCVLTSNITPRLDTIYKLSAEGPGGACCQEITFQSGSFGSPRNCVVPFRPTPPPAGPPPPSPSPPGPSKPEWWKIWKKVIPSKEPAAPTKKTMERL